MLPMIHTHIPVKEWYSEYKKVSSLLNRETGDGTFRMPYENLLFHPLHISGSFSSFTLQGMLVDEWRCRCKSVVYAVDSILALLPGISKGFSLLSHSLMYDLDQLEFYEKVANDSIAVMHK